MSSFPLTDHDEHEAELEHEPPVGGGRDETEVEPERKPSRSRSRGKTGAAPEPKPRRARTRSRSTADTKRNELAGRLQHGLESLADVVAGRDTELAGVLRQDAAAIGKCLASLAGRHTMLGSVVGVLVVALEPIQAFGRLAALTARRWRERRDTRRLEYEQAVAEQEHGMDQRPAWQAPPGVTGTSS